VRVMLYALRRGPCAGVTAERRAVLDAEMREFHGEVTAKNSPAWRQAFSLASQGSGG
jgi:hypothetical protein